MKSSVINTRTKHDLTWQKVKCSCNNKLDCATHNPGNVHKTSQRKMQVFLKQFPPRPLHLNCNGYFVGGPHLVFGMILYFFYVRNKKSLQKLIKNFIHFSSMKIQLNMQCHNFWHFGFYKILNEKEILYILFGQFTL